MQEPQVALANQEYIYYASPNLAVRQDENNSLYGNPVAAKAAMPHGQLLAALTKLELLDLAESAPGSRFRKK